MFCISIFNQNIQNISIKCKKKLPQLLSLQLQTQIQMADISLLLQFDVFYINSLKHVFNYGVMYCAQNLLGHKSKKLISTHKGIFAFLSRPMNLNI